LTPVAATILRTVAFPLCCSVELSGYRQAVRLWFLIAAFPGSNSRTPANFTLSFTLLFYAIGVSPSGKALVSDTSIPGFESLHPSHLSNKKARSAGFFVFVQNCAA